MNLLASTTAKGEFKCNHLNPIGKEDLTWVQSAESMQTSAELSTILL
jgi:hypothetical protein